MVNIRLQKVKNEKAPPPIHPYFYFAGSHVRDMVERYLCG
jgi:hypothetical protein